VVGLIVGDLTTVVVVRQMLDVFLVWGAGSSLLTSLFSAVEHLRSTEFGAALIVSLVVTGNYGRGDSRRNAMRLAAGSNLAAALILWAPLWSTGSRLLLVHFVMLAAIFSVAIAAERRLLDKVLEIVGWQRLRTIRTVFIGPQFECQTMAKGPAFSRPSNYRCVGIVDPEQVNGHGRPLQQVRRQLLAWHAEAVVLCGHVSDGELRHLVQTVRGVGCQLLSVPRDFRVIGTEPRFFWHFGQPLMELTSPADLACDGLIKWSIDVVASAFGLVFLSPLFLLMALAIKIDSPGPVFYRSERWGQYGRRIGIWKFRTMVDGAAKLLRDDKTLHAQYVDNIKLVHDPRVTRVGRWMRKFSLDELPQLFNVLTGEMSLVGPRPKLIDEAGKYGAALDTVLSVRPGLTGLWQISGRNGTTYEERVALDVQYVAHASIWWDMSILLRTFPVVLRGDGAH
jgi:exopolysaccharide biosynthesis polyprenyl glycosylphosphotransferase